MLVRPAEPRDDRAVAALIYETAAGRFDHFAGNRDRALRLLAATIAKPGNDTSRDGILLVEVDRQIAGIVVTFPMAEGEGRRHRFNRMAMRRRAPSSPSRGPRRGGVAVLRRRWGHGLFA